MSRGRKIWLQTTASLFVLSAIGFLVVRWQIEKLQEPSRTLWKQINRGDEETKVRTLLGQPRYEYFRESAPENYYVEGWGKKGSSDFGKGSDLLRRIRFDFVRILRSRWEGRRNSDSDELMHKWQMY